MAQVWPASLSFKLSKLFEMHRDLYLSKIFKHSIICFAMLVHVRIIQHLGEGV